MYLKHLNDKIAYLFLTYDNIVHKKKVLYLVNDNNMYIHPKYLKQVNNDLLKYVIKENVKTEWGGIGIVHATLELLKEAYAKEENKWFVLLSQDVYPIMNSQKIEDKIKSLEYSVFDYIAEDGEFTKTSQWWILTRTDVATILKYNMAYLRYNGMFLNKPKLAFEYAYDELYFLSLLKWANRETNEYKYIRGKPVYTRWLENVHMHHPVIFNRVIPDDIYDFGVSGSLFLRKTLATFSTIVNKYDNKRILMFICVEEKNMGKIEKYVVPCKNVDYVLLTSMQIKHISPKVLAGSSYIYQVKYKTYDETFIEIYNRFPYYEWGNVFYIQPSFDLSLWDNTASQFMMCNKTSNQLVGINRKQASNGGQEIKYFDYRPTKYMANQQIMFEYADNNGNYLYEIAVMHFPEMELVRLLDL